MPISKSRRFEVFKRDGFTCQYCGQRPPEVILEVDHIDPRALGGSDDEINLITSCADCNRGKSAKRLGDVHPRPDADLRYLEVQQEIAEAERYQQSLAAREIALGKTIQGLVLLWNQVVGGDLGWQPKERVIRQFLARYSPEIVEAGIRDVAPKVLTNYIKGDSWVPYMWSVMRNIDAAPNKPDPMLCSMCQKRHRSDLCYRCSDEIDRQVDEDMVRRITGIVPR